MSGRSWPRSRPGKLTLAWSTSPTPAAPKGIGVAGVDWEKLLLFLFRRRGGGLIERFSCPTDGRSTLARLTDQGRGRLAKAAPGHVRLVRELIFDQLDEGQVSELGTIAARLVERLKQ
jgi:hypothetical protein